MQNAGRHPKVGLPVIGRLGVGQVGCVHAMVHVVPTRPRVGPPAGDVAEGGAELHDGVGGEGPGVERGEGLRGLYWNAMLRGRA
jgi:hypothetical protein